MVLNVHYFNDITFNYQPKKKQAGRELASVSRPNTKGPPIAILSDGTLF